MRREERTCMTEAGKKRKNGIFIYGLVICSILAYLGVFTLINMHTLERFCNSDVYADMQVAKRMWEQKTLFPEGWIFGNQFYVVATPVLAAVFYGITGNINVAMGLATEMMTVLIFLSLFWMLRSFVNDQLSYLVCCLLLLASGISPNGPYALNVLLFFTQASFYACYLITMFIVFGDYVRAVHSAKIRLFAWLLSLVLCFATGMQSLRQTVVMVLPIMACECFLALRRVLQHKKPWDKTNLGSAIRAVSYGLANVAGKMTMDSLNVPNDSIYGQMRMLPLREWLPRMQPVKDAFANISGLDYIVLGEAGILFTVASLFWIGLVIAAAVLWLGRINRQETDLELCWLLCLVGMIGVILSTVVLDITLRGMYLFTWYPLLGLSAVLLLNRLSPKLRAGLISLICALSLGSLYECYVPNAERILFHQDTAASLMCDWAMENGYEYIYGDYWGTAPQIAVYAEGEIEAGSWHTTNNIFVAEKFNTPQDIYGAEENKKAIYVFTSDDEQYGLRAAKEREITLEKVAEFGIYYGYTSPEPLMDVQNIFGKNS